MCHYTTRSDGQKPKAQRSIGLRYTSEVKVEVARIHFQTEAITHIDEWLEISVNDGTKFVSVMNGPLLRAVLFVHSTTECPLFPLFCLFFFPLG